MTDANRFRLGLAAAGLVIAAPLAGLLVATALDAMDDDNGAAAAVVGPDVPAVGPVSLSPTPAPTPDDASAPDERPAPPTTAAPATTAAPTTVVPPPTDPPPPADPPIVVSGTVAWTDTGLDVVAGGLLHFRADGTVFHNAPDPTSQVGPAGDPRPETAQSNLQIGGVPIAGNHSGLVGRIGDGEPFVMGEAGTVTAPSSGRLFLGVNDIGVDNNDGAFYVEIGVQSA